MTCFIGLDNGGTETKAAIYDAEGRELAVARAATAAITPFPGFVERDMEEMWQTNCRVIREVLEKSRVPADRVKGVAVCGHGKGLYLWGKDGRPVRNGIISTDNRAYEIANRWKSDGTEEKTFELACQHVLSCQPVAILAWMKVHEPEILPRIKYIFEAKDYIRYRLTGEARAEITDYSGANLMNLHTRDFDSMLLRLFGIEEAGGCFPPLCTATEICGTVTGEAAAACGLKAGTPVAGGMFDIDACMLATGVIDERDICMIAGTWSVNLYLRRTPVLDKSIMMNTIFALPEYYLIEECSPTSAGNNAWFADVLLPELKAECKKSGGNVYHMEDEWVEAVPPEEFCPVYLPFLAGSHAHPNAKACFAGMSSYHTRKHLARSVFEGIAFSHRFHLERLLKSRETPPRAIRLAGGVTNSAVWSQMFADVAELPVETVRVNETGALGCAIAAAVATGTYRDINEAVAQMTSVSGVYQPDESRFDIYREKYQLYLETIRALNPVWDHYQRVMEHGLQGARRS